VLSSISGLSRVVPRIIVVSDDLELTRLVLQAELRAPAEMQGMVAATAPDAAPEPADIVCVPRADIDEDYLVRHAGSIRIYVAGDGQAPLPPQLARHFDIVVAGDARQESELLHQHPDAFGLVLPRPRLDVAPAAFFPTDAPKDFDVICIAPASVEQQHERLFEAFARLPPSIRGLFVFDGGTLGDAYRAEVEIRRLNITCLGPMTIDPPVLNALINRARIGVVCGEGAADDRMFGAYLSANLPVLACSGLDLAARYLTPETGAIVEPERLDTGILDLLARAPSMRPREVALGGESRAAVMARLSELVDLAWRRKALS
jgi:hypothetical protein